MSSKLELLRSKFSDKGLNNLVISYNPNIFYMTGFSGSSGLAYLNENDALLITDGRYTIQANKEVRDFEIIIQTQGTSLYKTLSNHLKRKGVKEIAVEASHISYEIYQALIENFDLQVKPSKNIVEELRYCKSNGEVQKIQKAIDVAIDSFNEILPLVKPGIKESDLAAELQYQFLKRGAKGTGFPTIVASGKRSALPHGQASDKVVEKGDIITFDFSTIVN